LNISTLVDDIYAITKRKDGWFTDELAKTFSEDVAKTLQAQLSEDRGPPRLRLSQMGPKCPCALWHSIHKPELAEPLPPWAEIKYSYGHIIEALALTLAEASGHKVEGMQDELSVDGILGHRDAVIDGCLVDVKSTSSFGFKKFKDGSIGQDDSFGYLDQLDGYLLGSANDPLVTVKDRAYLLAVDKQLGHVCLYEHKFRPDSIRNRIADYKRIVALPSPPGCNCATTPDGKSGNIKLGTVAGYNAFKHCCFPNLRTFLYASGPVYLTKVVRKPDVIEIDKFGNIVYN
jgi:hypothetical protein